MLPIIYTSILAAFTLLQPSSALSAGKGFGKPKNVSFDRFRASCPEDLQAIQQYDASLPQDANDTWVAVYRSNNNLPNVFVRDQFLDAMKSSTTVQTGDAQTLVSSTAASSGVLVSTSTKPIAIARLTKSPSTSAYILDCMRCTLKKEDTSNECDGGSEHTEALGICIDELVYHYLQQCLQQDMKFDGGIRFRGTLVSGKLLEERGFREVTSLSEDMHSHESDYLGALMRYAERSTDSGVAKSVGCRDRALRIMSVLGRLDRHTELVLEEEEEEEDFDPWASLKKNM